MTKRLFIAAIIFFLFLIGCDETTDVEIDDTAANVFAREGFALLNEMLLEMEEPEDPQNGNQVFPEADYNQIKDLFEQALEENSDNALANFGMAVLEIASVNYDQDLWDLINDFDDSFAARKPLGNQFSFLTQTSLFNIKYFQSSLRGEEITLGRIQDLIENNVLPKLENAIIHLNTAASLPDSITITIDTEEELLELDRGEIYAFRAGTYAISAAMRMLILYDYEMTDENGNYDWMDNMDNDELDCDYQYDPVTHELYIQYYEYEYGDSLLMHIMNYNLTQRPEFMTYRPDQDPADIHNDMNHILTDLQNLVDYVTAETDNQDNDIIQYDHIMEMNEEIAGFDEDDPNFVQNWQTVDDVIDWISLLISGPMTFIEDFDDDGEDEEMTVDFSRLYDPGLDDMKDYLPYHNWLPEDDWMIEELDWIDEYYYGGGTYYLYCDEELIAVINDVEYVYVEYYENYAEPIEFLDGPDGNVIDEDEEFIYLPDYTLNGMFPEMDRAKWIEFFEY